MREKFAQEMQSILGSQEFNFVARQRGMFGFTGLTPEQVDVLREQYSIYVLRSGRINVAGLNSQNIQRVCQAICDVKQQVAA